MNALKVLNDFKLVIEINVAWIDMDSLGHVNSSKYFTYFESARIAYFDNLKLLEIFAENKIAGILATNECSYIKPLFYPDNLKVGARVSGISNYDLTMEYFIESSASGLSAIGGSNIVFFDFNSNKKIDIPTEIIEQIRKFENL